MAKQQYARTPPNITTMPPGVPYIIGNEAAERFSFYGMRSILIIFMTQYLVTSGGATDHMGDAEARQYFALFVAAVYFLPDSRRHPGGGFHWQIPDDLLALHCLLLRPFCPRPERHAPRSRSSASG